MLGTVGIVEEEDEEGRDGIDVLLLMLLLRWFGVKFATGFISMFLKSATFTLGLLLQDEDGEEDGILFEFGGIGVELVAGELVAVVFALLLVFAFALAFVLGVSLGNLLPLG